MYTKTTTAGDGKISFRSRIRFRMHPASAPLAEYLIAARKIQVLFEHPESGERIVSWPLDTETAILERTSCGPLSEIGTLYGSYDMQMNGFVSALSFYPRSAKLVPIDQFEATDPL